MDHPRPCGLAALAALVISIAGPADATPIAPPASGVGDATLATAARDSATRLRPADRTVDQSDRQPDDRPDPTALAERIAARIAAADAARTARAAAAGASSDSADAAVAEASVAGSAARSVESSTSADAAPTAGANAATPTETTPTAATSDAILPAPRPSGDRFIDRFDRSGDAAAADGFGGFGGFAGADAWWSSPEVRVGGLLAVFIGMAVVARRWSNTRGPRAGRPSGVLSVLARYPFGRGASLVLLEVGPRMVLVHQQGGRGGEVRSIAEFTTPEEVAELRTRLGIARRDAEPGFGPDLERQLGRYDRKGRPQGFGGPDGLPLEDVMETVDLTRRRPRRGSRAN